MRPNQKRHRVACRPEAIRCRRRCCCIGSDRRCCQQGPETEASAAVDCQTVSELVFGMVCSLCLTNTNIVELLNPSNVVLINHISCGKLLWVFPKSSRIPYSRTVSLLDAEHYCVCLCRVGADFVHATRCIASRSECGACEWQTRCDRLVSHAIVCCVCMANAGPIARPQNHYHYTA